MKKIILFFLIFLLFTNKSFSYELVLPKEKKSYVSSNYAFFVGKARNTEIISINDERITVASNGAFAHSVKLRNGENRIVVRSNYSTQIYRFYKTEKTNNPLKNKFFEFDNLDKVVVKNDNVPLRNTPVNAGMNRISHLFKDTELIIDGEQGEFFRVFLSKDKKVWVAKKDVIRQENSFFIPAEFLSMDGKNYKNATSKTIEFSKNIPYIIEDLEDEILFKIYNPELSEQSVYTINIPKTGKYYYQTTLDNGKYTFKVNDLPKDLNDIVVTVDPGHGGNERGAIGCLGDEEKNINLKIALELKDILQAMGIKVFLTRECDGNISLNERIELAKKNNSNLFISIHLNSIGDVPMNLNRHKGTSVFYFNKNSKNFAEILERKIVESAKTRKDGVHEASFAVIRPTEYIGVLVEAAYMTNPFDTILYKNENFAYKVAKGIADGVIEFLEE